MRDPDVRNRRSRMLHLQHVAPLTAYVAKLRRRFYARERGFPAPHEVIFAEEVDQCDMWLSFGPYAYRPHFAASIM
jgi:hypothetical protein